MLKLLKSSFLSEKCFQLTPPQINNLISSQLPKDWLKQLAGFFQTEDSNLDDNCFNRHLELAKEKKFQLLFNENVISLEQALQLVYQRLTHLDREHSYYKSIIISLIENIEYCTQGFINRLSGVLNSLQQPQNFDELLYQSRFERVKNVAATLSKKSSQGNDVHGFNQVIATAAQQGLGVECNFSDPLTGGLKQQEIIDALQDEFNENYNRFSLAFLLVDQLRGILQTVGYNGFSEQTGYENEVVELINLDLKKYFPNEFTEGFMNFYIINKDTSAIHDINWERIHSLFFEILNKNNYFTNKFSEEEITNLLDCALFSKIYANNELLGIEDQYIRDNLFDDKHYQELMRIKKYFSDFWIKLTAHSNLVNKTPSFIADIEKTRLGKHSLAKKLVLFFNLNFNNISNYRDLSINLLKKITTNDYNALTLVSHYQPADLSYILKFLNENHEAIPDSILEQLFFQKNAPGYNVLIATSNQPTNLNLILRFLTKQTDRISNSTLQRMFLQTDMFGDNALMFAARYNPEGLNLILKFLTEHVDRIGNHVLQQIFLEKNWMDYDAIKLAAAQQPLGLHYILNFLAKHADLIGNFVLQQLLLEKDPMGSDVLMITALRQPQGLSYLLKFLTKQFLLSTSYYPDNLNFILNFLNEGLLFIEETDLQQMFLEKDSNGFNGLMLVAYHYPEALNLILEFLTRYAKQLGNSVLQQVLLEKNLEDRDALMLVANFHPEHLSVMLDFLIKHPDLIDKKDLKAMFLQKINDWNLLTLAAYHHPNKSSFIFDLLVKYPNLIDKEDFKSVFLDKVDDWNTLIFQANYNTERLKFILNFLIVHPNLIEKPIFQQIFLEKDSNGYNALLSEAYYNKRLGFLLNFFTENPDLIEKTVLQQMFLEKDSKGYNALTLAARYQPESLKLILNFLIKHTDRIANSTILQLLLEKDSKNCNVLMLAASNQPESLKLILKFLSEYANLIDDTILQQLFLQQNSNMNWSILKFCNDPEIKKTLIKLIIDRVSLNKQTLKQFFLTEKYDQNLIIIENLLEKYLEELCYRRANNITHTTRFFLFNFGYSTDQKHIAALALKAWLEESNSTNKRKNLLNLKQSYSALSNGRLSQLFNYCESSLKNPTFLENTFRS